MVCATLHPTNEDFSLIYAIFRTRRRTGAGSGVFIFSNPTNFCDFLAMVRPWETEGGVYERPRKSD